MWIRRFFKNWKMYKRFLYLEKEYYTYKRVEWVDIRIEYKELLDTINWNQTPWSKYVLHSAFIKYRATDGNYQGKKVSTMIIEDTIRRVMNGNNKH